MRLYDYAASGNCYKVRLALAQLEPPYERVPIDIFDGDTLTDEFGRLNPARRRAMGEELLRLLDDRLASRDFVAGERYSVADIVDDLEPYPANARPGAGRSTYEPTG